ncbi:tRNA (adenosine(37)-N6)-dimethylallyltransferase MiaA [Alkalicoccus chagannorensis]|uniref:tRNA (adenosine(37)-N6)-dimethylallyltransferase MiaA n=1 Tax=Alkalicoccus chagannorensis TaxID=427072 RepID=UPI00040C080C|nr:tRNA (adenosine(37)-N6)-dimethylallyltransferase MiaA [Alkalicoccus chagannorensis]
MKQPLIVICGPTAVGKSELAVNTAETIHGEIISGDSMQVYRGFDIGTAKVDERTRSRVPHHLIDIRSPEASYSAADFKLEASAAVRDITSRGAVPVIAGGTGMYLQSLIYDYHFAHHQEDPEYRAGLERRLREEGPVHLHEELRSLAPETAAHIHVNNTRRVIRALENIHTGSTPARTAEEEKKESVYDVIWIGLYRDRAALYDRINQRVDIMMDRGLPKEADGLYNRYGPDVPPMRAIGYKELLPYLDNQQSLQEAADAVKKNSRRYAKRQLTWFRNKMPVQWFDVDVYGETDIINVIKERLQHRN